jgi:hypothetical protein
MLTGRISLCDQVLGNPEGEWPGWQDSIKPSWLTNGSNKNYFFTVEGLARDHVYLHKLTILQDVVAQQIWSPTLARTVTIESAGSMRAAGPHAHVE